MLTELRIKSLQSMAKSTKHFDAHGLYLEVTATGGKYWRYKYRYLGKEKRISLGTYPAVSLKEARGKRQEAHAYLINGIDPADKFARGRRIPEDADMHASAHTFQSVAESWLEERKEKWRPRHYKTNRARLEKDFFPSIGDTPIESLKPIDILTILKRIEARGARDVAHKCFGICSMIFRYAVASCILESDPCRDLKGALAPSLKGKFAAVTEHKDVGPLMRAITDYEHSEFVRCALLLSAYTFCRPGEIRHAEWTEIDFEKAEWIIPGEKMKGKLDHLVPLSRQALDILEILLPASGNGRFVFPSIRTNSRPMSDGTVNSALRRLGYTKEEMTAHGFRAMASTRLNEMGFREDVIERQLAHIERNKVRGAYNRAKYIDERRAMMQQWADYLDNAADEK